MKYMGSKNRIAKHLLPLILQNRKPEQYYVEPFAGGMNVVDKVSGNRIASDVNRYLIAMWRELVNGWVPYKISREEYYSIRDNKEKYPDFFVGWAGFNCSYCGKWFDGFAGETKTKTGQIRDYQEEAIRNVVLQAKRLLGVTFLASSYLDLQIPDCSIIYCDPPYENKRGYSMKFDHVKFWEWCRQKSDEGHQVFISEFSSPEDFSCVWQKEVTTTISANGRAGGSEIMIEKLFVRSSM